MKLIYLSSCRAAQFDYISRFRTPIPFSLYVNYCHMQMWAMSKEFKCLARHTYLRKQMRVHDNVIAGQIYKRTPKTINAERHGLKRPKTSDFDYWLPGQVGAGLVSEIRPRIRTVVHLSAVDYFTPRCKPFAHCRPGCAAGRSPFLSSVQFKENACHSHVPIHSYGFA